MSKSAEITAGEHFKTPALGRSTFFLRILIVHLEKKIGEEMCKTSI